MRHHLSALLCVFAGLMVAVAPAAAQQPRSNAPPGLSGLDQYLEAVPEADGDRPTGSVGRGGDGARSGGRRGLSQPERERLAAQGQGGDALAELVNATAPAGPTDGGDGGPSGGDDGAGDDGDEAGDDGAGDDGDEAGDDGAFGPAGDPRGAEAGPRSPLAATIDALSGDSDGDGLGWLLPAILVLVAVAGVIAFLVRRRLASAK
jgi:hypothetical protein